MADRWVVNASPLIVLAHIGHAELLIALADQIVVPHTVTMEIEAGPTHDPARQALAGGRFVVVDTPPPSPELLAWDLGGGETAVLSFAIAQRGWTAVLDDAAARRCARSFDVAVKGTLGVVLLARQRGLITSASDVVQLLINVGFRIDDSLLTQVLAETVHEAWPPRDQT